MANMKYMYILIFLVLLNVFSGIVKCNSFKTVTSTRKKACYGTRNGFSFSGSLRYWYNLLRARYTGCTHVFGNLEISNIERAAVPNIDLSFLSTIEVVTGYVIIVNVEADVIPFTNLRHIRADKKYKMHGTDYALLVLLSDVRDGLQMPKIKEISGNVMFYLWSSCYPQSIVWDSITKGTTNYSNVKGLECDDCHPSCLDTDGQRRCWGPGKDLCQKANRMKCAWLCRNGSCFEKGILGCCHPDCLGCYDDWINTECEYCRHFRYRGRCLPECPDGTYRYIDTCIEIGEDLPTQ
ncbi:Receptor tyrosine-protein kinase erbB-2 [Mactra antiquata]